MRSLQINARSLLAHVAAMTLIVVLVGAVAAGAQGTVDDPAQVEAGMAVFETNCARCHGVDGTGSNTGRPLVGIAEQQPDRLVHIASVTDGKGNMPVWGDTLTAEEIDAAVSYVRLTFVAEPAEAELAVTGRTSSSLMLVAVAALAAGMGLLTIGRRRVTE